MKQFLVMLFLLIYCYITGWAILYVANQFDNAGNKFIEELQNENR